jgi:TatD DNase family protein
MMFIDTHCHLYLPEFKDDIDSIIQRACQEDVRKFFLPAIDSSTCNDLLLLETKFPGTCYAMMGLHPCSVKENYLVELQLVEQWFNRRQFAAVGEIGLDFYWDRTYEKEQVHAFHQQIEWALHYDRPIVIHSRNAVEECIQIVKQRQTGNLKGIFHCFSGTYDEAIRIIDVGMYLGIGGVVTYKNAGLAEVISRISLDHIVLETDAPYLAPVPYRGKRNESSFLKYIIEKISVVKNVSATEVGDSTTKNANMLFAFPGSSSV